MGNTLSHNDVQRIVSTNSHQGHEVRAVSISARMPAETEAVWRAITDPQVLETWFLTVSGDLKVGGRFDLKGNASGEIERCVPREALELTWEIFGDTSWCSIQLTDHGSETDVTLHHFSRIGGTMEEHWQTFGPGAAGVGWEFAFFALFHFLASGQPPEAGWEESDAAKGFARDAAKAWGLAHIASGEEESVAKEMAANTSAFYCAE